MNVQRLIEKYGEKFKLISKDFPYDRALSELWYDIEQLDEPKPVKVPQFVAKKIEHFNKMDDWGLFQVMDYLFRDKEIRKWLDDKNNQEKVARAWLDGYEVEKEERYVVSLKNGQPLVKSQPGDTLYFNQNITVGNYKATRKELEEAGFGWVFDCPGIEIEEVE